MRGVRRRVGSRSCPDNRVTGPENREGEACAGKQRECASETGQQTRHGQDRALVFGLTPPEEFCVPHTGPGGQRASAAPGKLTMLRVAGTKTLKAGMFHP